MTENRNNEKSARRNIPRYTQFVAMLSVLLFLSLSNSQKAAVVSTEQSILSDRAVNAAASTWQNHVDTVPGDTIDDERLTPKQDPAPRRETAEINLTDAMVPNDTPDDTTLTTLEPKQDIPLQQQDATASLNMSQLQSKNTTTTTTTALTKTIVPPKEDPPPSNLTKIPKEPREYYEKFPPCQIRVNNQKRESHFEVIESIAKLMPYEYFNLNDQCNHYHLHFVFNVPGYGLVRANSWAKDFNARLWNTSVVDKIGIQRSFGPAVVGALTTRPKWDMVIQTSCSCDQKDRRWLLDTRFAPRVCIGHGKCQWSFPLKNYIQMSPHYERYFVPSALPHFDNPPFRQDHKLDVCTIGAKRRRNWKLLTAFFDKPANQQYFPKIRIRMLGKGGMPKLLLNYTNLTEIAPLQIADDRKFLAAVKSCSMIMLPITKNHRHYKHYFKTAKDSQWKLSGTIPPIIAYERPFLLPNEILELYRKELPLHVPHRGFEDENDDFADALSSLLEELLKKKNG